MQRIFRLYLEGRSDRVIATENSTRRTSPARPEQNRHRSGDGWQATTVGAILQNPRYTGYAVFGRWTKTEQLLDPDDVAAGNIVKFKRSPAQRTRPISSGNIYQFRGRVYCDICSRKMQGEMLRKAVYYRCRARTLPPGSPVREIHPPTVNPPRSRHHRTRRRVAIHPVSSREPRPHDRRTPRGTGRHRQRLTPGLPTPTHRARIHADRTPSRCDRSGNRPAGSTRRDERRPSRQSRRTGRAEQTAHTRTVQRDRAPQDHRITRRCPPNPGWRHPGVQKGPL
ncbi:recombinase family protein [Nocardia sp. NPDC057663]|uniref:recombinase family protein n=1 Tax=Nocardia sp. NPDC057663 TaxID=3346201 RepID=UPI00366C9522